MGTYSGPNIVSSGLLLYTDSNNTKKSWKGAPTTNILPNPSINGRFTTDNQWGTYNTNQYNGNQYFSIGTISSVDNNIVTTSSNHPLRTYDVVTPQTTGGGVTAGTNYFVKKIDNTHFSLHAYNASQSGAEGYINPSTGYHKVHDSLALDQRVSINAASFPTMWWGPPHLPNSGLVKQIVQNVGPEGQPVMRLHIPRLDRVVDGMAYGVYTPVTVGDIINVSYWVRTNYPGKALGYSTHFGGYAGGSGSTSLTTSWQKVKFQWTASVTYNFYQYWWPEGTTIRPYWIDICDLQVEINTGTAASTPFTLSSRSNTQAILDLTNLNTLTASSLTYNNDETYSFNGSSNYISSTVSFNSTFTIECWFKLGSTSGEQHLVASNSLWGWGCYRLYVTTGSSLSFEVVWNGGGQSVSYATTFNTSIWYHTAVTYDGTILRLYLNGELVATATKTLFITATALALGRLFVAEGDIRFFNGSISNVKIYSLSIFSDQIKQDFIALRSKYNI